MPTDEIWASHSRQVPVRRPTAFSSTTHTHTQLVDDVLDFSASSSALGKPSAGTDLRLGLTTGPVLYAAEEHPELEPMIARAFKGDGDVDKVCVPFSIFYKQADSVHTGTGVDPRLVWDRSDARARDGTR